MKHKIEYFIKKNRLLQLLYIFIFSLFFRFLSLFIRIDNKIILFNGHGKRYNDSPKVIFEQILKDEYFNEYIFYWAVDSLENISIPRAILIKQDSFKYFIISLKAKIWVSCVNIERGLKYKKKKTIYLNTWHGIPLKHVGNKVSGRKDFDFSFIDIFCASGQYDKKIYIEDFNVRVENIIISGLPRNDDLYLTNQTQKSDLKKELNIPLDKKIILYAPTWRESGEKDVRTSLTPPITIDLWKKILSKEYIVLFRAHAYTAKYLNIDFDSFIRDYSNYKNINDLMIISDVLISDYSATILDYSILNKPILCFGYDYDQYKQTRGLYVDLDKIMPYGVIYKEDIIIDKLLNLENYELKYVRNLYNSYFDVGYGATSKCIDEIKKRR